MKLHDESVADYLVYCRQAIIDQRKFLATLTDFAARSTDKLQDVYADAIDSARLCLDAELERYENARKGIYG